MHKLAQSRATRSGSLSVGSSDERAVSYEKLRQLGSGRFGKVSLLARKDESCGKNRLKAASVDLPTTNPSRSSSAPERKYVALKRISKRYQSERSFAREIQSQAATSLHPCVTKLVTSLVHETRSEFRLGLEFSGGGDLGVMLRGGVGVGEDLVKSCIMQISHAAQYVHEKGFSHLDIKPENILIHDSRSFHLKLCDFGDARELGSKAPKSDPLFHSPFSAPELLDPYANDHSGRPAQLICRKLDAGRPKSPLNAPQTPRFRVTNRCDVWSVGMLLIFLVSGETPWKQATLDQWSFKEFLLWRKGDFSIAPRLFENFLTDWSRELMVGALNPDQEGRWPISAFRSLVVKPWCRKRAHETASGRPRLFCDPLECVAKGSKSRCGKCFCALDQCMCEIV